MGALKSLRGGGRTRGDGDGEEEWVRDAEVEARTECIVHWKI